MASKEDKWVRIFDIPDTNKHKKGFTIYKIISMLYPESCPDAITKITVWKRYNDFKKLHGALKLLHKTLKIRDKIPSIPNTSFFKRFQDEVLEERKSIILNFLEYISKHSQLFTSNEFVKFFETSHTPSNMLSSSINSIRAELNLPSEPEYLSFHSPESDEECTISDTDSISTLSSISPSIQTSDFLDPFTKSSVTLNKLSKKMNSEMSVAIKGDILIDGFQVLDYPTPPETPNILDPNAYIVEAGKYITQASEYEVESKFGEAFIAYKQGIDILLRHVKGDVDIDRRQMVRFKTEKYLLRAEKLYNLYLSPDVQIFQKIAKENTEECIHSPISELYKYKVIKVIDSGMMVLHTETQLFYFVKVIHKTCIFSKDDLILPNNVPFMVNLYNTYNCENAIFLILEYHNVTRLWEFVKQTSRFSSKDIEQLREYETNQVTSDNESECSYSELFYECAASKNATSNNSVNTDEILTKSQELIISVDAALKKNSELKKNVQHFEGSFEFINVSSQRRSSNASTVPEVYDDFGEFTQIPIDNIIKWSAQLLICLERLHRIGIVCCDLQSKNLLIDDKGNLLLSYMYQVNGKRIFNYKGNLHLAPELYKFDGVSTAADWWSFGTILYELLVGIPIAKMHPEGILIYTLLRIPKYVSPEGKSLIKQLLNCDPKYRLGSGLSSTEEIKSHPFFNSIKWDDI